jgi:hypothetical protein
MSTGSTGKSTAKGLLSPWKPGQSGNPAGRAKTPPEIKEALQAATPRAVAVLVEMLESDDDRVRIMAANSIMDRSLGKPVAALEVSGPDGAPLTGRGTRFDWSRLSAEEFRAVRETLMRAAVDAPAREAPQVIDVTPTKDE